SRPVARFRAGDADGRAWAYGARADQPRLVFDLITPVTWFGRRLGAQFCVLVPANGAATDWPPGTPVRVHGRLEFTPGKPYSGRYLLVADRVERLAAAGAPAGDGAAAAPAPRSGARGGGESFGGRRGPRWGRWGRAAPGFVVGGGGGGRETRPPPARGGR